MSKYDGVFRIVEISVPVQYGNFSKQKRRCYDLGAERMNVNDPDKKELWYYYRIAEGMSGEGRFFYIHYWWAPDPKTGERVRWTNAGYIRYSSLPLDIRNKIEGKPVAPTTVAPTTPNPPAQEPVVEPVQVPQESVPSSSIKVIQMKKDGSVEVKGTVGRVHHLEDDGKTAVIQFNNEIPSHTIVNTKHNLRVGDVVIWPDGVWK